MNPTKPHLIALSAILLASVASAREIRVGTGPHNDFSTIQAAINAAHRGDDIDVAPGTYAEQLVIGPGKDNLNVGGTRHWGAIIVPPPTMTSGALITVNGAHNVNINEFTISGPLPEVVLSSSATAAGIYVGGGGSAVIQDNYITQIWQVTAASRGIQNGVAIEVGRQFDGTTGSAAILNNTIDHFQKNAMEIDNNGSYAAVFNNTVIGEGPIDYTAQNGIQVSRGASGWVQGNTVRNMSYTPATYADSGILLFETSYVAVTDNDVKACDLGIALADVTHSYIERNHITNGLYGLDIDEFSTGSTNNRIDNNDSSNNSQEGIYVSVDSINNQFDHNKFKNNAVLDAEDDSVGTGDGGTGNDWDHNKIGTDNHGGALGH